MKPDISNKVGKLVLVATPIGNLDDMSPRAVEAIENASVVFAEDTRRTAKFVTEMKRLYSYHDHNAAGRLPQLLEFLQNGFTVALVSDAGMPGISDPSFKAVRIAVREGFQIEVIPGPTAVTTALVGSGLPVDRFAFEGFLPRKVGARKRKLEEMSSYGGSIVYFIGPHHLLKYLGEMHGILGNRPVCIAREITKVHEEYIRGNISDVIRRFGDRKVRGEITLVVGGKELDEDYFD
ncbi:MAG: 16S rRNA (cytidine(1402)-2'-O)-methyltransferase [Candidatus Aegiribacteria sp.]|nr:16S rRNA (cytidine(1402)-2'-O)-methyltransferase [Candidatus Aegiribacteria sp.]